MNAFAVAQYFSIEARRIAAEASYRTCSAGCAPGTYRRSVEGRCPVGVMLQADGFGARYGCPDSQLAASAIHERIGTTADRTERMRQQKRIGSAVAAFIQSWESGAVVDLRAALGLPREDARQPANSGAGGAKTPERGNDGGAR